MATAKKTRVARTTVPDKVTASRPGKKSTTKATPTAVKGSPVKTVAKTAKTSRGRSQDRSLIAGEQAYEVRYVASKTGHSMAEVKKAIQELGHSRVKVIKALSGKTE